MARTKATRSDSAQAAIDAAVNVSKGPHSPPSFVRLRKDDMPFWIAIMNSRARDEWTETDLVIAAQLARCQYDIEQQTLLLESEGCVVVNGRGTDVANPRVNVLEQFARREMALMRTLRMGGRITEDTRDTLKRRQTEQRAREVHDELQAQEGKGLLA